MRRNYWLRNDFNHSLERAGKGNYDIEEGGVCLTAFNLGPNDVIPIEVRVAGGRTQVEGADFFWAPLYRSGCPVRLTAKNNQIYEVVPGNYRLAPVTLSQQVAVAIEEEERGGDKNVSYVYLAGGNATNSCEGCPPAFPQGVLTTWG